MAEQRYVRRGIVLSLFLGIMIVAPFLAAVLYVIMSSRFGKPGTLPAWTPWIMAILCLFISIFSLAAWNWKKAGVIGLGIMTFLATAFNYSLGFRTELLIGLFFLAALILLVRPVWKYFR